MEELFHHGTRVPLSRRVLVDEQAFLNILDQMRIAVPEEIRQAKRLTEERDRLLAESNDEAERIRTAAQEHAGLLLSQAGLIQAAEEQAAKIVSEAQEQAAQLRADADAHCISVLTALESEMRTIVTTTRNGIQHLQSKNATTAQAEAARQGASASSAKRQ
jgi:hypothetical protein